MEDTRWNTPGRLPLSNGPMRAVTAPAGPRCIPIADGQMLEYLLPFPIHVVDQGEWRSIQAVARGVRVNIVKPISLAGAYEPEGRLGNESPDAYCTTIRVCSTAPLDVAASDCWSTVQSLLAWIRIKARHYWILHGITGFGALYRGSLVTRRGNRVVQENIATYGRMMVVRPLDEPLWLSIQNEIDSGAEIPVEESIFCDALLSAVAGDELKAVLEAGVAAEVALTRLLVDVTNSAPDNPGKRYFRKKKFDRHPFNEKLQRGPTLLQLQKPSDFVCGSAPKNWVELVTELYELRNRAAHGGVFGPANTTPYVTALIFAANGMLQYCREQRQKLALPTYDFPTGRSPAEQLVLYRGEYMGYKSETVGLLGQQ